MISSTVAATRLPPTHHTLSQHGKYRKASQIAQRLAALASEATGTQFDFRQLQLLEDEWKGASVVAADNQSDISVVDADNANVQPDAFVVGVAVQRFCG